jgi:hypothetical protein
MTALSGDYTGCSILIYDAAGNHLCSTVVTRYEKSALRIDVQDMPLGLEIGGGCRVLILTSPTPCEYQGRIIKDGTRKNIAMYQGHEKESRGSVRYAVNSTALIENLVCDGRAYPLHTPLEVEVINISKSGVRFRAPDNSLTDGDRFQMRIKISTSDKLLIVEAVNHLDSEPKTSEYGCCFLIGSERVV